MGASSTALDAADHDLPFEAGAPEAQLNPATWKLVRMRAEIPWDDGTLDDINVETLQSPAWLRDHDAHVGGWVPIPMDLAEMGLPEGLQAKVLAIERCPSIDDGAGRVVLTTINHLNADVMELTVETADGRRETFQPTGAHKLYRASDNRWVSACELQHGDQLAGTEEPLTVVDSRHVPGVHRVFNMTVQGEHVYHVSSLGALAHNANCFRSPKRVELDPNDTRIIYRENRLRQADIDDVRPFSQPLSDKNQPIRIVVDGNGKRHIMNGNHRIAGAAEDGISSVEVEMYTPEQWKEMFGLGFDPTKGVNFPAIE
jgi:hypothetical protein